MLQSEWNTNLNNRSRSIAKATSRIDGIIHEHLLNLARFIAKHGNVTPATFFIQQFPAKTAGVRTNAIKQWLLDFGGCSWNDEKKTFGKAKDFIFDEQAAIANPWNQWKQEAAFVPVDSYALLEAALKKMNRALDDKTHEHAADKINPLHVAALEELLASTRRKRNYPAFVEATDTTADAGTPDNVTSIKDWTVVDTTNEDMAAAAVVAG